MFCVNVIVRLQCSLSDIMARSRRARWSINILSGELIFLPQRTSSVRRRRPDESSRCMGRTSYRHHLFTYRHGYVNVNRPSVMDDRLRSDHFPPPCTSPRAVATETWKTLANNINLRFGSRWIGLVNKRSNVRCSPPTFPLG